MTAFNVNCPHCGMVLTVQSEWAGLETSCPNCHNSFVVPPPPNAGSPVNITPPMQPATPPQPAQFNLNCPHCGTVLAVQPDWSGLEMSCPNCQQNFKVPGIDAGPVSLPQGNGNSSQENVADDSEKPGFSGWIAEIAWALSAALWVVSIILFFCGIKEIGAALLLAAIITSVISFIISLVTAKKFRFDPGETLVMTTRLYGDGTCYYTRVTNQRVVLSAVEYPLLPYLLASLVESIARPSGITYSWRLNEISSVEIRTTTTWKIFKEKTMYIIVNGKEMEFAENPPLMKWWAGLPR